MSGALYPIEDGTTWSLYQETGLYLEDALEALRLRYERSLLAASDGPVISATGPYEWSGRHGRVVHVVIANGTVKREGEDANRCICAPDAKSQLKAANQALLKTFATIIAMKQPGDRLALRRELELKRTLTDDGLNIVASIRCCWV